VLIGGGITATVQAGNWPSYDQAKTLLEGWAALLGALGVPAVAAAVLWLVRHQLRDLVKRIAEAELFGQKVKIRPEVVQLSESVREGARLSSTSPVVVDRPAGQDSSTRVDVHVEQELPRDASSYVSAAFEPLFAQLQIIARHYHLTSANPARGGEEISRFRDMLKAMLRRGALTDRLVGDLDQAVSLWLDATTAPPWERGISQPEAVLLADTARTLTQQLRHMHDMELRQLESDAERDRADDSLR